MTDLKQVTLLVGARLMGTTVRVQHGLACPDIGPVRHVQLGFHRPFALIP